jgi:hypothetical protein
VQTVTFHAALPDETPVYRSVKRWAQIPDGVPIADLFHRRESDERGMSVDYNVSVPDGCGVDLKNKKGVVLLYVGKIRGLPHGLDVIPDDATHANINTSVPVYDAADLDVDRRLRAEQIAAALAGIADPIWIKEKRP